MKRAVVAIACCCGAAGGDVAALVAAMTREEKHGLLNGHGWQGWDLLPEAGSPLLGGREQKVLLSVFTASVQRFRQT